ncbi:MAG: plasmid stabilization protein [Betaproteobacteria bacterium]
MPRGQWSAKRERQYTDIKKSLLSRGRGEKLAEEIAARTVNKERAQHGEAKHPSPASLHDTPAPVRGGERAHAGAQGRTYEQLYADAKRAGLAGRSRMTKAQLAQALKR